MSDGSPGLGQLGARPGGYDQAVHGSRLHALLYVLMRDGNLQLGAVHELVEEIARGPETVEFSNDFLAAYAIQLVGRLHGLTAEGALENAHAALRHAQAQGITPA